MPIFFLLGVIVLVVLMAAGFSFMFIAVLLLAIPLLTGVLSTSILVGLLQRSITAAAKALIIQLLALCGVPAGVVILLLTAHVMAWPLRAGPAVVIGVTAGAAGGAMVGLLLTWTLSLLCRAIVNRLPKRAPVAAQLPLEAAKV